MLQVSSKRWGIIEDMLVILLIVMFVLVGGHFLYSCTAPPPRECTTHNTRCNANEAQVCDPMGQWVVVTDCNELDGTWVCVEYTEETPDTEPYTSHTCVPEKQGQGP